MKRGEIMTMTARAPAPMTGEDCANLISLFNSGWGELRLAEHYGIDVEDVRAVLEARRQRRGLSEREALRRLIVHSPIQRGGSFRPPESGDGMPKFANHEQHIADVVARGGFWAWSERREDGRLRLGLPMLRPVFDGGAR